MLDSFFQCKNVIQALESMTFFRKMILVPLPFCPVLDRKPARIDERRDKTGHEWMKCPFSLTDCKTFREKMGKEAPNSFFKEQINYTFKKKEHIHKKTKEKYVHKYIKSYTRMLGCLA